MRLLVVVLIAILALVMVAFGVQNTQGVTVRFLTVESGLIPLAFVMVLSAIAGALLVGLIALWDQIRHGFRSWRMRRRLSTIEKRTAELEDQVIRLTREKAELAERGVRASSSVPGSDLSAPVG